MVVLRVVGQGFRVLTPFRNLQDSVVGVGGFTEPSAKVRAVEQRVIGTWFNSNSGKDKSSNRNPKP